tara:strand:+ start:497 stop:817 length:321 start_codon:yes stop_codon:yes gene_type:complete
MKWHLTTCKSTGERFFVRKFGRQYVMLLRPDGTQRWYVTKELARELCTRPEKFEDQDLVAAIERTYLKFFREQDAEPEPTPPPRPMGWERKRKVLAEIDRTRRLAA